MRPLYANRDQHAVGFTDGKVCLCCLCRLSLYLPPTVLSLTCSTVSLPARQVYDGNRVWRVSAEGHGIIGVVSAVELVRV